MTDATVKKRIDIESALQIETDSFPECRFSNGKRLADRIDFGAGLSGVEAEVGRAKTLLNLSDDSKLGVKCLF